MCSEACFLVLSLSKNLAILTLERAGVNIVKDFVLSCQPRAKLVVMVTDPNQALINIPLSGCISSKSQFVFCRYLGRLHHNQRTSGPLFNAGALKRRHPQHGKGGTIGGLLYKAKTPPGCSQGRGGVPLHRIPLTPNNLAFPFRSPQLSLWIHLPSVSTEQKASH